MMALAALQRPSFDAAVPRLVSRDQQTAAAALMSMSASATILVGSALGGVLAITPGASSAYALDVAGYLLSFGLLSRLPALPRQGQERPGQFRAVMSDFLAGLRYAGSRKDLLGSYLVDLAAMIFAYPNALLPFMAAILHAPWAAGLMFAAPFAGALVVSSTSGWMGRVRRHGLAITISAACWGLALAAFGLSPDVWAGLALLAVAGGADMASGIFRSTLWNQTIPDDVRGRMAGIELLSYAAGPPAGQLRSGAVASLTSTRASVVSGGLACAAGVAMVCAALPAFRRYSADGVASAAVAEPSTAEGSERLA
jgi:hypothetical protein